MLVVVVVPPSCSRYFWLQVSFLLSEVHVCPLFSPRALVLLCIILCLATLAFLWLQLAGLLRMQDPRLLAVYACICVRCLCRSVGSQVHLPCVQPPRREPACKLATQGVRAWLLHSNFPVPCASASDHGLWRAGMSPCCSSREKCGGLGRLRGQTNTVLQPGMLVRHAALHKRNFVQLVATPDCVFCGLSPFVA